jgi:Na+/proline symporter
LQVQRVIVAKDLRAAQNGTIIGAVLKMCVPLIVTLPGLLGLAVLLNPDGSPMVLVAESDVRANITNQTYNDVLPLLMSRYLGPGLLGLGVTAMIAGFMSGMAGNVSAFATVWTYDVYKPLIRRNASDSHYLNMGRWASLIGMLISIGTAYSLFYFSNILDFLQVLIFFFIVPLFGVVILGMLWKRCTPAGGFFGFLLAIGFALAMWIYVHTFPDGHRPPPKIAIGKNAVVRLVKVPGDKSDKLEKLVVESGSIDALNVPLVRQAGATPTLAGDFDVSGGEVVTPTTINVKKDETYPVRVLAETVVLSDTKEKVKFAEDGLPLVLMPGVKVHASDVTQWFSVSEFNSAHAKHIARSEKAKPMAINMYSAIWTLVATLLIAIGVSLFTKPKPDAELKDLVMGLTPLPNQGSCPWYESPKIWASLVLLAIVALNILFW